MKLSNRSKIDSFIVMDVMEQARIEELSGRSIIHMEVGQPGTPAPISAIEALKTKMNSEPHRLYSCPWNPRIKKKDFILI